MGVSLLLYLGVGGFLLNRALKTKIYSMIYLAMLLFLVGFCLIAYLILGGASEIFFLLRTGSMVMGVIFMKKTFYQDKKLKIPFNVLLIGTIIITVVTALLYTVFRVTEDRNYKITSDIIFGVLMVSIGMWQYFASNNAYQNIKNFELEPYIKKRYQLFSIAGIIFSLSGIFAALTGVPERGMLTVYLFSIMSTLNLIYLTIYILVWVMPTRFKQFLNERYKSDKVEGKDGVEEEEPSEELSEEELMASFMEEI
jgi:hypothetical protein